MENCTCPKCGHVIPVNSKFCLNCGTPIPSVKATDKTIAKVTAPSGSTTKFLISGRQIVFSSDVIEYNKLRVLFSNKASDLELDYISFYKNRDHNFRDLFDIEIPELVLKAADAVKFGVHILMEYGIDDIDENELATMVSNKISIRDCLFPIIDGAEKIEAYADELAGYRTISRAGHGYWEGGGFGLGGAIKGALTAGALNLGTNMFRGIGDSLVNANDRAKINSLKKDLANCNETFECLHNTVYKCCFSVFFCVKEILVNNRLIPSVSFEYKKATARASNYLEQYKQSGKSAEMYEKIIDVLCSAIQASPYSVFLYRDLYLTLKGDKHNIHSMAKFFGIEREYKKLLIISDSNLLNEILEYPENTVEEIDKKIEQLFTITKGNPYIEVSEDISRLKSKIETVRKQTSKIDIIKQHCTDVGKCILPDNIELLWDLASRGNPYAEEVLFNHYINLCKPLEPYWYETEKIKEYLKSVKQRAADGDILAAYILAYLNNLPKAETFEIIKRALKSNVSVPLYYTGYLAIKERSPRGQFWNAEKAGLSKRDALMYIAKAAQWLYPPALEYLGNLFHYGKWGLINADEKLAKQYSALSDAYKQAKANNSNNSTAKAQTDSEKNTQLDHASRLEKVKGYKSSVDNALQRNDIDLVWTEAEKGNPYAEYTLSIYYKDVLSKIDYFDKEKKNQILLEFKTRSENGSIFATYLYMLRIHETSSPQEKQYNASIRKIIELANKDCSFIQYVVGTWGISEYYGVSYTVGKKHLQSAADNLSPLALQKIGLAYYERKLGYDKDLKRAEQYLELAAAYDIPQAQSQLERVRNTTTSGASDSSSCFITSATCLSLGKGDNCYELNAFRHFRDNWLRSCADGTQLIKEYYNIAPKIVSNIDKREDYLQIYEFIWNSYLKRCLTAIEAGDNDYCKKLYCEMVYTLKERYGT